MSTTHPIERYINPSAWAFVADKVRPQASELLKKLIAFLETEVYPAEALFHAQMPRDPAKRFAAYPQITEDLKLKAQQAGLWNLFLPKSKYPTHGVELSILEYAIMAELMGRGGHICSEVFNCSAPDTGNMEVLAKYGTPEQQKRWLEPLLQGKTRSAFAMTEPAVASSDATNIETRITVEGDDVIISGRKWYISGAGDPRCAVHLVMGKSDPTNANKHRQQSIVLVPADAPGVKVERAMHVLGYDDAPEGHMEISYNNVRVPKSNVVLGLGRGFEVVQGRLGPGRIHHCMRSLGAAEFALDKMLLRATDEGKKAFGKTLSEHGTIIAGIAESRIELEQARLLVLMAANRVDQGDAKAALRDIAMSKVAVVRTALRVVDRAMQAHGAEGISQDSPLSFLWAGLRTLRYADGPDEVHLFQLGKLELRRAPNLRKEDATHQAKTQALLAQNGVKSHL